MVKEENSRQDKQFRTELRQSRIKRIERAKVKSRQSEATDTISDTQTNEGKTLEALKAVKINKGFNFNYVHK